jgi:CRP-like cAMP-binding protein
MAAARTKLRVLRTLPPFVRCSPRELRRVSRLAEVIDVPQGSVLIRQGRPGHEFFTTAAGTANVVRDGRTVAVLECGDHFGELALLHRAPRNATVIATTPVELVVIEERAFHALLSECPTFGRRVRKTVGDRT